MVKTTDIELSITIAAHNEGILANKTLASVRRALRECDKHGISYEVIANLDSPTPETELYFKTQDILPLKTVIVHEGDLSGNRMAGIRAARGRYVAIIDADDLCSKNWFVSALEVCRANKNSVVHTEYSINFGTMDILWKKSNSTDIDQDAIFNVQANRWDSALVVEKSLLEKYGYLPNKDGFGSEDWDFNMRTLADGISHLVAPQTILFVRRKESGSELDKQRLQKRIVRPSNLLALNRFRDMPSTLFDTPLIRENIGTRLFHNADKRLKAIYHPVAHNYRTVRRLGKLIKKVGGYDERMRQKLSDTYPKWLLNEWKEIHSIEKQLFPSDETLKKMVIYNSEHDELGRVYRLIAEASRYDTYDYVLFVPYLNKGGADLVAIRYANTIQRLDPTKKVCVIATIDIHSDWASKLDDKIDFISFGEMSAGMSLGVKIEILGRFITNINPEKLHIINSKTAYRLVSTYSQYILANEIKVYICAFCEDINEKGRVQGYIHTELPQVYPFVERIFTDNKTVISTLSEEYGYDTAKFRCHYIPVDEEESYDHTYETRYKLLWASRISFQKQPHVLRKVAEVLAIEAPNISIDVYGSYDTNVDRNVLKGLENVSYEGTFNGMSSIDLSRYDALLYTSLYDGIPNTLLEAANAHLPIITSLVGGIRELCENNVTAITVEDPTDVDGYVAAIKKFYSMTTEDYSRMSDALYARLRSQHTQKSFDKNVRIDILDN